MIATVVGTLILIAALCYTLAPMMGEKETWIVPVSAAELKRETLSRDMTIYLTALKDIDFEHASNKINADDHRELKSHYRQKISRIIQALEKLDEQDRKPARENG